MEKNKFEVGDIVRFYGDNNKKYRVLEIKEDGTLATESLISGNKYFFQQCQVELVKNKFKVGDIVRHTGFPGVRYEVAAIMEDGMVKVKDIQNGMNVLYDISNLEKEYPRRQPIKDMNNEILKLGDIVRIYDSQDCYKITELDFLGKLVRLSTLAGNDRGVYGGGVLVKVAEEHGIMSANHRYLDVGDFVRDLEEDKDKEFKIVSIDDDGLRVVDKDGYEFYPMDPKKLWKLDITGFSERKEDLDKSISESDVPSYDGFGLKVGDAVKIHDDTSGSVYYITELNLVNRDWYAKLKDKDDYNHGFFNTSELELVTDRWLKMGDYVKYHNAGDVVYMVMEIISKDQVRAYRVNDGNVMDIFSLELEKASAEELIRANGEYINSVLDMELARHQGAGCGKDGSGKDDRADGKPRWELLPLDAIEEIVKVYTMGAEKYADNAWKTIPDAHRRYLAALFRHVAAYERGERLDKESGLSHLAHAAWNAIAILWFDINNKTGK